MKLSNQKLCDSKKIKEIINSTLKIYGLIDEIDLSKLTFSILGEQFIKFNEKQERRGRNIDGYNEIRIKRKNPFEIYLTDQLIDRTADQGLFYSFKKPEHVEEILNTNKIHMSSLSQLKHNDPLEYYELLSIINPFHLKVNERNKENIFIFCFTKDFRNADFWKTYGKNNDSNKVENIAIGFRFKKKEGLNSVANAIGFHDVIYNYNNRFDFIKEIQYKLHNELNKTLCIDPTNLFARFFKRQKFSWENETRLCIDLSQDIPLQNLNKLMTGFYPQSIINHVDIQENKSIKIHLDNPFFNLEISELICGEELCNTKFQRINENALTKNIKTWKYKL